MIEDDSRLLKAAQRGDEAAFLALYLRYRTPLFRFAWRLLGYQPAAEDVLQECFLVLLKSTHFDRGQGSLRAYLFGIVRNLSFGHLRRNERECEELVETDAGLDPLADVLHAERSEIVARAVAELPPLQREAVILFEYEGLSLEEIAIVAGVETGTVKARLHRAREALRRALAPLAAAYL